MAKLFIGIYLISMLLFICILIVDGKKYAVKAKDVFNYYGGDSFFAFVPFFNTLIIIVWVIMKIFIRNKF